MEDQFFPDDIYRAPPLAGHSFVDDHYKLATMHIMFGEIASSHHVNT